MNNSVFKRNFSDSKKWVSPDGEERSSHSKVVRCKCGKSKTMPFCDNSHRLPWYKLSVSQNLRGMRAQSKDFYIFASVFTTMAALFVYRVKSIQMDEKLR
uniref:Iron-binding zinc finger CDGSH type domain-containing protein n=1 Tax=Hanusia phi TaxID=3032 RepID=A0A7S0I3Z0_9CRYP|mmetsp:Transcript_9471/g.21512  ORF Transcript_9471/g.21512 Transcript_9471/m.21512 type:complete len:100 (+) Transcript_9471:22-321(+)